MMKMKGQLIVLYGRRRVGKTETLREFCRHKPHVFYSCTQSTDGVQLAKFSKQILREDIPAKQYISELRVSLLFCRTFGIRSSKTAM